MSQGTNKAYADRINRVCGYIETHLNDDLSLECLSRVAHFSKFHFHRQFAEYMGINAYRYIQLMRLKRASHQLVHTEVRITDIALDAGFESHEAFSRAFKKVFGQTPSQFRTRPAWKTWHEVYQFPTYERNQSMNVNVVMFPETKVAVYEHLGSPGLINDSATVFAQWRKSTGFSPISSSKTFGIPYQDPGVVPPEEFRFDVCGSVTDEVPENPQGVINKTIPGGRCAVVRHLGSLDRISATVHALYGDWLPDSGEELRDFPVFFHYLYLASQVEEKDLVTDIYLPLK